MRVLHVCNWYPSNPDPNNAPWIQKQINALPRKVQSDIIHLEVNEGTLSFNKGKNQDGSSYIIIKFPFNIWRIFEWISFLLLIIILFKRKNNHYDVINFHIVYPNCTYLHLIKKWIKSPIVFTEHWSGYHYNFNIKNPNKRRRIQRIFQNYIPVITVSNALGEDIKKFSSANFSYHVIPNVINTSIFKYSPYLNTSGNVVFLMVSQWKWPKNPFIVIEALSQNYNKFPNLKLRIVGYGPQWEDMIKLSTKLNSKKYIEFLGYLKPAEIAEEMNKATAFIHCSEYETFSVVCAESICCGTPVIASDVGGIKEFINDYNGILIQNSKSQILHAVDYMMKNKNRFNNIEISKNAIDVFNSKKIGDQYIDILEYIIKK